METITEQEIREEALTSLKNQNAILRSKNKHLETDLEYWINESKRLNTELNKKQGNFDELKDNLIEVINSWSPYQYDE